MSDDKPRLVRIERPERNGGFKVVFRIGSGDGNEISVLLPASIAEENVLAIARHRLHELIAPVAASTEDWKLLDQQLRELDPPYKPRSAFPPRRD